MSSAEITETFKENADNEKTKPFVTKPFVTNVFLMGNIGAIPYKRGTLNGKPSNFAYGPQPEKTKSFVPKSDKIKK